MTVTLFLGLLAIGTLLALDSVSVGQVQLARPLPASALAGWWCGDLPSALAAGVLLELIALETMPVGASRYPDWAPAGVVAAAVAAVAEPVAPALVLAVIAGLLVAWASGQSMVVLRHANGRRFHDMQARLDAGDASAVGRLIGLGIAGDAVRGALVMAGGLALVPVAAWLAPRWALDPYTTAAFAAAAGVMVAAGATRQLFHGAPWARTAFAVLLGVGILAAAARWS